MPYKTKAQLPPAVKGHLPPHAQKIFQEAFNHAWDEYQNPKKRKTKSSQEEVAYKVAWSAVKKKYSKNSSTGQWVEK